ncbi:MAG: hypothetical protein P8X74_12770 [Reinekea sp.]
MHKIDSSRIAPHDKRHSRTALQAGDFSQERRSVQIVSGIMACALRRYGVTDSG